MRPLVLGRARGASGVVTVESRRRFRHLYVIGRSGAGKSSLLHRVIQQDARAGHAVVLFDPGDLADDVRATLPDRMRDRVLYFSPSHPIPYNPLVRRRDEPERLEN